MIWETGEGVTSPAEPDSRNLQKGQQSEAHRGGNTEQEFNGQDKAYRWSMELHKQGCLGGRPSM